MSTEELWMVNCEIAALDDIHIGRDMTNPVNNMVRKGGNIEERISMRKLPIVAEGRSTRAISLPNARHAMMALGWYFGRTPKDKAKLKEEKGTTSDVWLGELRNNLQERQLTLTEQNETVDILTKLEGY